jgi:hypothetical protein
VPDAVPKITPVDGLIDAIVASLVDHVPPAEASDHVIVKPSQTDAAPVIATGVGFTVRLKVR